MPDAPKDIPKITGGPSVQSKDTAGSQTTQQSSKPTTTDTGTSTTPTPRPTADASTSTEQSDLNSKSEEQQQSLWEQLLEAFKKFLNLQPQNNNQNLEEQEKRRKKQEEEEEEERRRLLVRSLSSIFIEFSNLNQMSSKIYESNSPESNWSMPGYMEHGFVGPNSEIKAFAEHFSQNNLSNALDKLLTKPNLDDKESAYQALKQGVESFKKDKQRNVPEKDKLDQYFGLDINTANQINLMSKYLDDYINGVRQGKTNTQDFKHAEGKLKHTQETIKNPYYSPNYEQPKPEPTTPRNFSFDQHKADTSGYRPKPESPRPQPNYRAQEDTQNVESSAKTEKNNIASSGEFIKNSDLIGPLSTFLDPKTPKSAQNIAYRVLALSTHPDKVASQSPEIKEIANQIFKQINNYKNSIADSSDFSKAKDFLTGVKDSATSNVASSQARPSSPGTSSR